MPVGGTLVAAPPPAIWPHRLLRHPHAERAVRSDFGRNSEHRVGQRIVGNDPADQADAVGFLSIKHSTAEE
jgi:hypothetical protein